MFNQIILNYDNFKDDLEDCISEALTDSFSIYLNNVPFFQKMVFFKYHHIQNELTVTTAAVVEIENVSEQF